MHFTFVMSSICKGILLINKKNIRQIEKVKQGLKLENKYKGFIIK